MGLGHAILRFIEPGEMRDKEDSLNQMIPMEGAYLNEMFGTSASPSTPGGSADEGSPPSSFQQRLGNYLGVPKTNGTGTGSDNGQPNYSGMAKMGKAFSTILEKYHNLDPDYVSNLSIGEKIGLHNSLSMINHGIMYQQQKKNQDVLNYIRLTQANAQMAQWRQAMDNARQIPGLLRQYSKVNQFYSTPSMQAIQSLMKDPTTSQGVIDTYRETLSPEQQKMFDAGSASNYMFKQPGMNEDAARLLMNIKQMGGDGNENLMHQEIVDGVPYDVNSKTGLSRVSPKYNYNTTDLPEVPGYKAVPDGNGRIKYVRTFQIPNNYDKIINDANDYIDKQQAIIDRDDGEFLKSQNPIKMRTTAATNIRNRQDTMKGLIDSIHLRGGFNDDERDGEYLRVRGLNIPQETPGNVRVVAPNGKSGSVPSSQLKDAIAKGYKVVK